MRGIGLYFTKLLHCKVSLLCHPLRY